MQRFQKRQLYEGQLFRTVEGGEWEFTEFISTCFGKHPHVALVKPSDRYTRKVISVDALLDRHLFYSIDQ